MTKKTLVSAITAALVVGAASTTFAASNPFTDVPADSWAYDAVTTLAADGVIDGYPDGTYKGQNTMTRYEMAQIVARAMAKTDVSKADKALVDKLAAEFADELDNLGVRVADLEKKSDNVKWGGKLRYRYRDTDSDDNSKEEKYNHVILRMEPKAYIGNSGWVAKARLDYDMNLSTDSNSNGVKVDRAWVEGPLAGGTVQAGKVPLFTAQGMIIDDPFSGATYAIGNKTFKTTLAAGRYNRSHDTLADNPTINNNRDITAEYYGVQFDYAPNDNLALNAGYTALVNVEKHDVKVSSNAFDGDDNNLNIWYAGTKYNFNKDLAFVGEYAKSDANEFDTAYDLELQYGNAKKSDPGSWQLFAGYRKLEQNAVIKPTYNTIDSGDLKGWIAGVNFVPAENIVATLEYADGKVISSDKDYSRFFGQVDFFF